MCKKIFALILLCNICTNTNNVVSAVNLNHVEIAVALLKIPAVITKNNLNIETKTKSRQFLNLSVDILRLANEILSIINKNEEFEFHKYDYFWATYDTISLVTHFADLFKKSENIIQNLEDIQKLNKWLEIFHIKLLPLIEGLTGCIAAIQEDNTIEAAHLRLECKTLNSAIRLFDNIITSKNKSAEQILYAAALVISIVLSTKDIYESNKAKDIYLKAEQARRQVEEARLQKIRAAEEARRQEEEIRQRKIREEEQARKQVEEARLQKIKAAEETRRQEEETRQRKIREEAAAHRRAEEMQLRDKALRKKASDPIRLAWEEVDRKQAKISKLEKDLVKINADIRAVTQEHRSASQRDSFPTTEYYSPFDELFHPPKDSWLGRQYEAEREEKRIQEIASRKFDQMAEVNRLQMKLERLQENASTTHSKLEEVRNKFVNAHKKALQMSREDA